MSNEHVNPAFTPAFEAAKPRTYVVNPGAERPLRAAAPGADWADALALELVSDAFAYRFMDAHKLIAAKLRVVKAEGVSEGVRRVPL